MRLTDLKMMIDFFEFVYVWFRLQGMGVPKHQKKIARWLSGIWSSETRRQALLMAFRNSGKSTIVGLFCAWILYSRPSLRILVIAADHALAKKMVRNVKRIIEQHPLTLGLKPARQDQWASDQFTVNRNMELRDPSMLAKGLGANITGLRADIIICDDVEVPKNCDTALKRREMREKLGELDYILTPSGMQLYIGTPHTYYTIYQNAYDADKPEIEPFLLGFEKLELPILNKNGDSAWPERFSMEKIASVRARSGESKFLSQMMLRPVNAQGCVLNPDLLNPYYGEIEVICANEREFLKIGETKMLSASCWWDPAFGNGGDNSVIACVFSDEEGHYWLHDLEYIRVDTAENAAAEQCRRVADFLERNRLTSVRLEINGLGRFLPGILRQELQKRRLKSAVLEMYSSENKQKRILEAFEVPLAARALNVHQRIFATGFIAEMREWSYDGAVHDDALDAVAGCLRSEPVRIPAAGISAKDFRENRWQGRNSQFLATTGFEV